MCRFSKFFAAQELLPNTVAQDLLVQNGGNKSPPIINSANGVSKEPLNVNRSEFNSLKKKNFPVENKEKNAQKLQ